ncbi:Leucine rich repeat protein [Entamoeba marina]
MQTLQYPFSTENLDSHSILIVSNYSKSENDFINLICVNSKFKETTEKLRFNSIPIKSLKLFPNIQTQYLYNNWDRKIDEIDKYEIWYKINYDQYFKYKKDNIKYHNIVYMHNNRLEYGEEIPNEVTVLGVKCYSRLYMFLNVRNIKEINIPLSIKSIGNR